jgi:ABC-type Fe3+/spermidine/putrescine transport system ATPase subunit
MIEIASLGFAYGEKKLLEGLDVQIKQGSRCVIMGASGSGKSSLLRLIAGLEVPDAGSIMIDGVLVSRAKQLLVPPEKRGLAMVFQDLALWPHMDVGANVAFGLKMQKVSKVQRQEEVAKMLALVGLEGYEPRDVKTLSGGEQQRVALARALVVSPKVLLMDEPLSSLDEALNKRLRKEIVRLQELLGFTLVYVTHNSQEAKEIGTQELFL